MMNHRERVLHVAAWVLPAMGVLALGNWIVAPLPFPAATITLGALLGLAVRPHRVMTSILVGGLFGLLVGVTVHLGSHYFEGRMDHADGLAYHMLENTAMGVIIAAAALGLAAAARYGVQRISSLRERNVGMS